MTKMPISDISEVLTNIEFYRDQVVFTNLGGRAIERPQGELHSIQSFGALLEAFSQLPAFGTGENKEWYVGVYPCVKEDKDGNQRLSFYCVPTIGEKGLTDPPGTPISATKVTDYIQAVSGAVTPTELIEIQDNVFDIGNHWP